MLKSTSLKLTGLAFGLMLIAGCQQQATVPTSGATNTVKPAPVSAPPRSASTQQRPVQAEQTIITVHLAQQKSEPSLLEVELGAGEALYALPQPILVQGDIREITPVTAQDGSTFIMFEMTPQGRVKLADISTQALGHFFLISAKGQLISVAQIGEPMTDGKLLISTNGSEHTRQVLQLLR